MADNGEQNEPIMVGAGDATTDEKITGIVAQVRQDHGGEDLPVVLAKIRERFEQAGIEVDDIKLARLAHEVSGETSEFKS
ncbi:hypothetical protein [Subtercola lobariae]|uniref:Uncharacterized protein n=1 Tax=Subtercola lobariae TaxID=1588641 RepID=A0A917EY36_9MICO|nr:hypothetical protein [Subtercola lobariae]GGF29407.1 hypothetical protein GCM10011399_23200 [Subtercola lobariae]